MTQFTIHNSQFTNSNKIELRERIFAEIAALPEDYISTSDNAVFRNVISLKEYGEAQNIMMYHSVKREPDTILIARAALLSGKSVAFPYCYKGGLMEARIIKSLDELQPAMLGIPAPPDKAPVLAAGSLDFIIVPALTYDRSGYRLGYGGGYYDRYLHGIPAFTAGLARERLIRNGLPRAPHDIAVKCLITEEGVSFCPTIQSNL